MSVTPAAPLAGPEPQRLCFSRRTAASSLAVGAVNGDQAADLRDPQGVAVGEPADLRSETATAGPPPRRKLTTSDTLSPEHRAGFNALCECDSWRVSDGGAGRPRHRALWC